MFDHVVDDDDEVVSAEGRFLLDGESIVLRCELFRED